MKEWIVEECPALTLDGKILSTMLRREQELIRCKDCKHGEPGACGDGIDCDGVWHGDDWFCADAERRGTNE